tara:strand:+ start:38 stop:787 length:750 start_codon:yes stop_codon:yes gene_type:complete
MRTHLFANGCSHTAGGEIEEKYQNCCHEKAWPKHLADSLNMDWTNFAISGGSAERVVRTTMYWFGKNPKRMKDTFAIIGWPPPWRSEIRLDRRCNYNQPEHLFESDNHWYQLNVGIEETIKEHSESLKIKDFYKLYKLKFALETKEEVITRFYLSLISLQSYFKTFKIPYIMFNTASDFYINDNSLHYFRQVDQKPFIDIKMLEWLHGKYEIAEHSVCEHYGEDGHIGWAKFLASYIRGGSFDDKKFYS